MTEETQILTKPDPSSDSHIGGVSIRAWLAVMLVGTVCLMALANLVASIIEGDLTLEIKEPLYSLSIGAVAYYFGQAQKNKTTP